VLYGLAVAVTIGAVAGYFLGTLAVRLRHAGLLDARLDQFFAVPASLLVYGLTEVAGAYGLVAAFCAGLAFRRYEFDHEYNRHVHDGAEVVEKFGELVVILLLGTMVTLSGLKAPGLAGWLLVPLSLPSAPPS
jgi:NhaP-type Na+/H+ or K+/H+ antiporter